VEEDGEAPSSLSSPTLKRALAPKAASSPSKKQTKWTPAEDALIIELRGRGERWERISQQLEGRSALSCRLHYQNYLERRSEWNEEKKDRLSRLYERFVLPPSLPPCVIGCGCLMLTADRFKPEMWASIAKEMEIPWRAAEAMHWQLGELDMADRAGVVPFSKSSVALEAPKRRRAVGSSSSSSTVPPKSASPADEASVPHTK